jgi:hypothetical protein
MRFVWYIVILSPLITSSLQESEVHLVGLRTKRHWKKYSTWVLM